MSGIGWGPEGMVQNDAFIVLQRERTSVAMTETPSSHCLIGGSPESAGSGSSMNANMRCNQRGIMAKKVQTVGKISGAMPMRPAVSSGSAKEKISPAKPDERCE